MRLSKIKEDGIMNKYWNGFLRLWWFSQVTYCTCHGSFYNFWSDTTRGEIPGRCFQMVKQNVKHFLKSIWHLEPYVILRVAWHEHFAGVLSMSVSTWLTFRIENDSFDSRFHRWNISLRTDFLLQGQKGRKEGINNLVSFFVLFYVESFCWRWRP